MTDKLLKDFNLGEELTKEDVIRFFGEEFLECFDFPLKLVKVSWTIQDSNQSQMDYELKHKLYYDKEELKDELRIQKI